ncbi:MAG TPA: type II toxin-antitoxin system PemK/MazF family toxin [Candidatus Binatia bacterium]|nr:type II toxin-antitoxin system PemK/MazF family toxin [Candidatus Binatia bacterium]
MTRGEIWWAELPAPVGRRPVVLVSRAAAYTVRASVTVAPVTRTLRGIPTEVVLERADGVATRCVINADDLTTIPKSLLSRRLTALSPARLAELDAAIRFALDLR